jgi:hypothetical protein
VNDKELAEKCEGINVILGFSPVMTWGVVDLIGAVMGFGIGNCSCFEPIETYNYNYYNFETYNVSILLPTLGNCNWCLGVQTF